MKSEEIIQKLLWEKFGKKNIKASVDSQEFNLRQTGQDYLPPKKDIQFYVYEDAIGISRVWFSSKTKQTLAWQIALDYYQGNLGSKFPTYLICIFNARGSSGRNEDGTFNCKIYHLAKNQVEQIEEECEKMVAESF